MSTKEGQEETVTRTPVSEPPTNVRVNIRIPAPQHHVVKGNKSRGQEKLSFQFNRDTKIQTLLEVLAVSKQTKFLTNVQLKHNGVVLNEEQVLSELVNKSNDPVDISLELRPYTPREVLKHTLITRDFIGYVSEKDDNLSDFSIPTNVKFHEIPLTRIKEKERKEEKKGDEKEAKREELDETKTHQGDDGKEKKETSDAKQADAPTKRLLDITEEEKSKTIQLISDIFDSFKLEKLADIYGSDTTLITPSVKALNLSQYNPVPPFYKSKGHLLYLQVTTLEGEVLHITAIPSGFYVNRSTNNKFDPSPRAKPEEDSNVKHNRGKGPENIVFYTLYDLIASHSKNFVSTCEKVESALAKLETASYTKPQTTYLHRPWLIPQAPTNMGDYSRLQAKYIDDVTSQDRNFNDEFQAIKDLPTPTLTSSIESERLLAKLVHEFSSSAAIGAMEILEKDLIAMNPDARETEQIFLKDNIFYSFVSDVSDAYKGKGGDEAAWAASNQDLLTISVLNRVNLKDVRYLLTTIVDFGGKRILAQTPVPGLLATMGTEVVKDEATGEETLRDLTNDIVVSYGYDELTKEIMKDEKFDKLLEKEFSKVFHLKKANESDVWFASQSKGIVGFDKRNYVLDLANTYPLDIEFVRANYDGVESEDDRYPHRQTLLRPELVEKWWSEKVRDEGLSFDKAYEERKFAYNPDAYQVDGVQDETVDEISKYLNEKIIPGVLNDFIQGNVSPPQSGAHLTDIFHKNGINMRYLGKFNQLARKKLDEQIAKHEERLQEIAKGNDEYEAWEKEYLVKIENMIKERQEKINKYLQEGKEVPKELTENLKLDDNEIRKPTHEEPTLIMKDELVPLIKVSEIEMIARSMKHILRSYAKPLPVSALSSLVSYVFNLLFGFSYNDKPVPEPVDKFFPLDNFAFTELTRESLLNEIIRQTALRFRYQLTVESLEELLLQSRYLLMKEICTKFGIQIVYRDFFFSMEDFEKFKQSQDKKMRGKIVPPEMTFSRDDFVLTPLVKTSKYTSITSEEYWNQGSMLLTEEKREEGLVLLSQAVAVLEDVSGVVHPDVAEKYLSLAAIYSKLGMVSEAIAFCRKCCVIYERVCGYDSFEMLRALNNLALLELANDSPQNAATIYKKIVEISAVFQLSKFHHPMDTNVYNHLEQISLGIEDLKLTASVLSHLSEHIYEQDGSESAAYGYIESRLGNLYASLEDYRAALEHIVKAKDVFTRELGTNNHLTASAKQWINGLTNLLNEIRQKERLRADQVAAGKSQVIRPKKSGSKKETVAADPQLAEKSVDELLNFIEGDNAKKSKGKKNKKGGNSR